MNSLDVKVVFVIPDMGAGGAERVISHLSTEFVNRGFSVDIVYLFGNRDAYNVDNRVNKVFLNTTGQSIILRCKSLRQYLKQITKSSRVIAISFHPSCLKSLVVSKLGLNVKVVATERNNPYILYGSSFFARIKSSLYYVLSDVSVFQTPDASRYFYGILSKHSFVIPNPIETTAIKWSGSIDSHKIVSVCRLTSQKNIPLSIKAIDILKDAYPDIQLDIYGEGEQRGILEQLVKFMKLDGKVNFCGTTSNVQSVMSDYSVFLSTSDYEGISNSMLEAMSVGLPCVCTDCPIGGARMMLSDGVGVLVNVGDVEGIVKAISYLFSNKNMAMQMSRKSVLASSNYSVPAIADRWIQAIS